MSAPRRIQLSRTKGWRKPEGAIVVSRPTKWGNPWTVAECSNYAQSGRDLAASFFRSAMEDRIWEERNGGEIHEVDGFYPPLDEIRSELAGRDLACWCPLDQPCHADVLLELANGASA
jgi:hypothetical protein